MVAVSSIAGGAPPPRSWHAGRRGRQRISRGGHHLNSRGRGRPGLWWRLHWVARHASLSPFVGVGAGLTGPVGIGKDGGHGGWLCWRWRGGAADYRGTKTKRRRQKSCLWTGLIHSGKDRTKSGIKDEICMKKPCLWTRPYPNTIKTSWTEFWGCNILPQEGFNFFCEAGVLKRPAFQKNRTSRIAPPPHHECHQ